MLKTIISKEEIAQKIQELAQQIHTHYNGKNLMIVSLAEDSFVFLSDLIRAINSPLSCCFIKTVEHQLADQKDIVYTTEFDPSGYDILLAMSVLDTGIILDYLTRYFIANDANTIKSVALIDKPDFRKVAFTPDFVGFTYSEKMIVGYGLGLNYQYKYLPYLASLD